MKRRPFIIAAILLVFATIIVSCKKDDSIDLNREKNTMKTTYQPPKIDDMNAYLKDFKQKMQTKGTDETMDLEEAAWHLSGVINYDFGDVVEDYSRFHYDTLYYNIDITDRKVCVSDLSTLYTKASSDIVSYLQNLNLDNKHIRFIGVEILENGSVTMTILVSYDWLDHQWYFPDPLTLDSIFSLYFSEDSVYFWDTSFPSELQRVLNIMSVNPIIHNSSDRVFYILTHIEVLDYLDYEDPYGSPFLSNSRIFAKRSPQYEVDLNDIRYCFDSYLALGDLFKNPDEEIIDWTINTFHSSGGNFNVWQEPRIRYCAPVVLPGEDPITPPIH